MPEFDRAADAVIQRYYGEGVQIYDDAGNWKGAQLKSLHDLKAEIIVELATAQQQGYRQGLEEAAKIAKDYRYSTDAVVAIQEAIRALMDVPQKTEEKR